MFDLTGTWNSKEHVTKKTKICSIVDVRFLQRENFCIKAFYSDNTMWENLKLFYGVSFRDENSCQNKTTMQNS